MEHSFLTQLCLVFLDHTLLFNDACSAPHTRMQFRDFWVVRVAGSLNYYPHGRCWVVMDLEGLFAQPGILFVFTNICQERLLSAGTAMPTSCHKTARQFPPMLCPY